MCDPILVTVLNMRLDPSIVNPVVKMRPHPAVLPHWPLIRKYPPPTAPRLRALAPTCHVKGCVELGISSGQYGGLLREEEKKSLPA